MKVAGSFLKLFVISTVVMIQSGCDQHPAATATASPAQQMEVTETIELSMESLIDRMVAKDKASTEDAHKKGNSNIVSSADGAWWLRTDQITRLAYIKAVGDVVLALNYINSATFDEIEKYQQRQSLEYEFGNDTLGAPRDAESRFSGRLQEVFGGRSFGDLTEAVTKFYQSKPLLKEKPVLWVLSVPLYRELQEAKPADKRNAFSDKIRANMKKRL